MKIQATRLVVRDLPYAVQVLLHSEPSIIVNPAPSIRHTVLVERFGNTAFVRGIPQQQPIGRGFSLETRSSLQIPSSPSHPSIAIFVPLKIPLAFSGITRAVIEGNEAPMQIVAPPGTERIEIGWMQGGSIVAGGGIVEVGNVTGEALSLTSLSTGSITVQGGEVQQFTGTVIGGGAISYHGEADVATLVMRGHGSLEVAHVSIPFSTLSGRGTIRIGGRDL